MRLIGSFDTEKEAYDFYSFLLKEGIQNIYDAHIDPQSGKKQYHLWVYDEDDLDAAIEWLKRYKVNPNDPQFESAALPLSATPPPPDYAEISAREEAKWQSVPNIRVKPPRLAITFTHFLIAICIFLFLWNDLQEAQMFRDDGPLSVQMVPTPLDRALLFDDPASTKYLVQMLQEFVLKDVKDEKDLPAGAKTLIEQADHVPVWKGLYAYIVTARKEGSATVKQIKLVEKIREGELWRLFTPCLMHRDFLHILFNMIWIWILSKQIEERIKLWKLASMIVIIGVVSNIAQYLMSGPYFLGISGVVVGMAGFIWMRQKLAPWEGYPLNRATLLFLLLFVVSMFALELFSFALQLFSSVKFTPVIANTAHVVGGLCGLVLGRISFFKRRLP